MKKLDLNALGIVEMDARELKEADGGTEIGYWLGYYGDIVVDAVGDAIAAIGETLSHVHVSR